MTRSLLSLLASSTLLLGSSAVAFAAPIANLSCGTASANLSYFSLGSTDPINVGGTGTGAGKVSFLPLTVHAALSQFQSFYQPYFAGRHFATCVLSSTAGGQAFKIELKNAAIASFNAQVSNNTAAAGGESNAFSYIEFTLVYASIGVEANGSDDGGLGKAPVAAINGRRPE